PVPFSFLQLPLPSQSTLFPYTTLFRSGNCHYVVIGDFYNRLASPLFVSLSDAAARPINVRMTMTQVAISVAVLLGAFLLFACARDRKSTRLNSSHVKISYAVFCLKQKK